MSFVHPLYEVGGVDCSRYQYPINFDILNPRISFFGARIGHASAIDSGRDDTYPGYMLNMRVRKKPRLSYWYWKPEISNDKQFYTLEPMVKIDWPEMGVYVDVEENYTGMSRASVGARLSEFLVGIDSIAPANTGELTGIYTGIAFWNNNVDHTRVRFLDMRPKWLALVHQAITYPPKPWAFPYGWNGRADLWQFNWKGGAAYTEPGKGKEWGVSSFGLDLNVYLGTRKEYELRFNIIPEGGEMEPIGFVATTRINMRPEPSDALGVKVIGQLYPTGGTVPVYKTEVDKKGRGLWYQISGDSKFEIWVASWVGGKTIYAS